MGIRVRKMIGYALTDVESKDNEIIDDRFDPLGYAIADCEDQEDIWEKDGFLKYVKSHKKNDFEIRLIYKQLQNKNWEPYDSIIYDSEYGENNIFLIIPPDCVSDYQRYDNTIDYYEETAIYKQQNRIVELEDGIYPYTFHIDKRTGKQLKQPITRLLRIGNSIRHNGWIEVNQHNIQANIFVSHILSQELGFKNYHDFLDNHGPMIPPSVIHLCKWLNLFIDEATIYQLKPILYVYWS